MSAPINGLSPSRRGFLAGGMALGASLTLPGCAYIRDDAPEDAPLPPSAKAEIDGDLVYFNWADYFHPKTLKGFKEEYGVDIIESNYDSMEGMYAKLAAGNEYDVVFPIAKWVVKPAPRGQAPLDRPGPPRTPSRSSTPAPTSTSPGTTRGQRSPCRSPSTRPGSAGAPTRSRP